MNCISSQISNYCYYCQPGVINQLNKTIEVLILNTVDDNLDKMWTRLDDKYGEPTKVTDVFINAIQNFKTIQKGETKKLLDFITVVEDGYRDLKRSGLEPEIMTTSAVSAIEKKLPKYIKRDWIKIVCNKFPLLLKFLLDQKKIIEYKISDVRFTGQITKRMVHHATDDPNPDDVGKQYRSKCLLHENGAHWKSNCRLYLSKSVEEQK